MPSGNSGIFDCKLRVCQNYVVQFSPETRQWGVDIFMETLGSNANPCQSQKMIRYFRHKYVFRMELCICRRFFVACVILRRFESDSKNTLTNTLLSHTFWISHHVSSLFHYAIFTTFFSPFWVSRF